MTRNELVMLQSLPLDIKIAKSQQRVREFIDYCGGREGVYVAFSGGKDSTVLLDIVRSIEKDIPAVFVDTGLEYPEIKDFVKGIPNLEYLRPEKTFYQVINEYGYPVVSKKTSKMIRMITNPTDRNKNSRKLYWEGIGKNGEKYKRFVLPKKWRKLRYAPFKISEKCCDVLKKNPIKRFAKKSQRSPFIGTMASDSELRQKDYLTRSCNIFTEGNCQSRPLGFWREGDVWEYIKSKKLAYSTIYDKGEKRTGCIFCMFGVHMEKGENRFHRMKRSHPKLWDYCIDKLGCGKVLDYIGIDYGAKI